MNKSIYLSTIGIVALLTFGWLLNSNKSVTQQESVRGEETRAITIAVCPTFYNIEIDSEKYSLIRTESTAQSLGLLSEGKVDLAIAGRTLYPNEVGFNSFVLDSEERYSFLSKESTTIFTQDLSTLQFFTELEVEGIKTIFGIENIEKVDDVYEYIDRGIVITSWENTDLSKADIVHVLDESGLRYRNSRIPTLYYIDFGNVQEVVDNISNI